MFLDKIINATLKFIFKMIFIAVVKIVKFLIFIVVSGMLVAFILAIYKILVTTIKFIINRLSGGVRASEVWFCGKIISRL